MPNSTTAAVMMVMRGPRSLWQIALPPLLAVGLAVGLAVTLTMVALAPSRAETWPSRPIKLVIGQPAGGAPDIICRLIATKLSQELGQQVVVDNRGGAAGIVGTQFAARAEPDGYTMLFGMAAALASHLYTFKSLPYDPAADFVPIAMVAESYFFILVHPNVPARTLSELIALDKANPGKLSIGADTPKSFTGILMAWLNQRAGTQLQTIPYTTITQGIQDALAERVQGIVLAGAAAAPHIKSGKLRPLAVTSAQRLVRFEQVPTVAETIPGVEITGWFVLVAPKGTPEPIVREVNGKMARIMKDPELLNRLEAMGFYTRGAQTPEATAEYLRRQRDEWGAMTRAIGLTPE